MMRPGITYRLFFSILGATGLAIVFLFLFAWWNIDRGFYQYLGALNQGRLVQMAAILEEAYAERGSWDFLHDSRGSWIERLFAVPPDSAAGSGSGAEPPGKNSGGSPAGAARPTRSPLVILDGDRRPLFGAIADGDEANFRPVVHGGRTVGFVGLLSPRHFLHPVQLRFLGRQRLALVIAAAGMVIVVMIISFPLARRLVRPIRAMAAATHDIASGRYGTRIPVSSSDELGQLARDFNDMALTLEKHEKEQRQWIADISHELRTPVAVLRGEIEALLDGIRPVTPETIRSLHGETLRLNRLLEDLYQLALSDIGALTYRKEDIDPVGVLKDALDNYRAEFDRKRIRLSADLPERPGISVFADRERLYQLFANLLDNTLKYTDGGGELIVRLSYGGGRTTIDLQDSPPGVPDAALERLFDRLYRVDESRNRVSGGAGLGLAICRNIVEGHDGTIAAYPSPLGGIGITVTMPASARSL